MADRVDGEQGDGPGTARETSAFDRWLHRQLHALYGPIASEPLPDDLIALVDRDAEKRTKD